MWCLKLSNVLQCWHEFINQSKYFSYNSVVGQIVLSLSLGGIKSSHENCICENKSFGMLKILFVCKMVCQYCHLHYKTKSKQNQNKPKKNSFFFCANGD